MKKKFMTTNHLTTAIKVSLILLFSSSVCFAAKPALFFSDMTDGPISGWEGSPTKGAAVTIWGINFGPAQSSSKVLCGGQQISATSAGIAEWGAKSNPTTARNLERITFFLNAGMSVGATTIRVETSEGSSRTIPFYTRNLGGNKIMFFATPSAGGSDSNDGLFANKNGSNGPKATLGLMKRDLTAGDVCYIRSGTYENGDTIDSYNTNSILDFWSNNHADGTVNKSITVKAYPGELVRLGGNLNSTVLWVHGSGPGHLHHWTFSNMEWVSKGNVLSLDYNSSVTTSHLRFIGLDATTTAGGKTIMPFVCGASQEYIYLYGCYLHDAGVDNRSDPAPSTKGYGFSFSGGGAGGNGYHNYIDVGWNESCYHKYGHAFYIYGHFNGDSIDNLYIHDNYFHHNSMRGAILGGGDNGGGGSTYGFVKNCWFYNNIVAFNGGVGVLIGDAVVSTAGGGGNFIIERNTFYKNDNGAFDIEPRTDSLSLRFNIVYEDTNFFLRNNAPDKSTGNCNLYFGNASDSIPSWDSSPILNTDPQFVKPASGDFRISTDSSLKQVSCQ